MDYDYSGGHASWWATAQICLNGHIITGEVDLSPELAQNFCDKCGAMTIAACQECGSPIRGDQHYSRVEQYDPLNEAPNYCHQCGNLFPWIARKLAAAAEIAEELELTEQEREAVKERLPDIVQDTPKAQASAFKLSRLLAKAGGVAGGMVRDIAVDIASETAKKVLLGQ